MDAETQQFVRVKCRLTVPRVNYLISLINAWSRNSLEYEHGDGVIVKGVYTCVPGSSAELVSGLELDDGLGGGLSLGGNHQQVLGGNSQRKRKRAREHESQEEKQSHQKDKEEEKKKSKKTKKNQKI